LEREEIGTGAGDIVGSATLGGTATYEYGSCTTLRQGRHPLTSLLFCLLAATFAEAGAGPGATRAMTATVQAESDDRIGLATQIAADLLPEAGDSGAVEAEEGL
jgi:hypothetical protein